MPLERFPESVRSPHDEGAAEAAQHARYPVATFWRAEQRNQDLLTLGFEGGCYNNCIEGITAEDQNLLVLTDRPRCQCEEECADREQRKKVRGIWHLPEEERLT